VGYPWYLYLLAIGGGLLAGVINTLAGSGSVVTLPILVLLGLPATEANATNRVGVAIQNIVGIATFKRKGHLHLEGGSWLALPALPGAIVGAWLASELGEPQMNLAIGIVMVAMLFVVLLKPQQWLREHSEAKPGRPNAWMLLLFFAIGIYGGFIQAGIGVFLLSALVMGAGYDLRHANAIKLMIVLAITFVALSVFLYLNLVDWQLGLLLAIGQSMGAWLAATYASSAKNANLWIRRLLIAVLLFSILKFFGALTLIGELLG
jgi:uncharacterized membrane protein YfcA